MIAQRIEKFQVNVPPPPDAAALGKYADIPVGEYTGTPNVNIPLYELKGRFLSLPISLSYHGSGVKVEEISSWVGIGWTLNAGGVITRSINGQSDFRQDLHGVATEKKFHTTSGKQIGGRQIPISIGINCDIWWEGSTDPGDLDTNVASVDAALTGILINQTHDTEPDMFYFNFMGFSGKFVFDENRNIAYDSEVPFEFVNIPDEDEDSWLIKGLDGVEYLFGGALPSGESWTEWSRVFFNDPTNIIWAPPTYTNASSWYLRSITHPSGESIEFEYSKKHYMVFSKAGGFRSELRSSTATGGILLDMINNPPWSYGGISESTVDGLFLEKIVLNRPDGSVEEIIFNNASDRQEDTSFNSVASGLDIRLAGIEVNNVSSSGINTLKSKYTFNHDNWSNKLWLTSVQEFGRNNGTKPAYKFEYHSHQDFPIRTSMARDLWGFYNGQTNNNSFFPKIAYDKYGLPYEYSLTEGNDVFPNEQYAKVGILTKIEYPTGGYAVFNWEPHEFSNFTSIGTFGDRKVCKKYSNTPEVCISDDERVQFELQNSENFIIETNIIDPNQDHQAAKVCNSYGASPSTYCPGLPSEDNFTIYGNERYIFLEFDISGIYKETAGNKLEIINSSSQIVRTVNWQNELSVNGTVSLNLPPGGYTLKASVSSNNGHVVKGTLIRRVVNPPLVVDLVKPDGSKIRFDETGNTTQYLTAGTHELKVVGANIPEDGAYASAVIQQETISYNYERNTGAGLRISSQEIHDGLGNDPRIIHYDYKKEDNTTSGLLMNKPVTYYYRASTNSSKDHMSYFETFANNNSVPLSTSAAGSHVGYERVIKHESNRGKTLSLYSNTPDFILGGNHYPVKNYNMPFVPGEEKVIIQGTPSTNFYYDNGNLQSQYVYNQNDVLLSQTRNTYESVLTETHGLKITSMPVPPTVGSFIEWDQYSGQSCNTIAYKYYTIPIGYSRLTNQEITDFGDNGQELESVMEYDYIANRLIDWKRQAKSNGFSKYENFSYESGTSLVREFEENLHHHTTAPLNGEFLEYANYLPVRYYSHETLEPGEVADPDISGRSSESNYKLRKEIERNQYGNIIELNEDGSYTSFIWAENQINLLAVIKNATKHDVEVLFGAAFEGNNLGLSPAQQNLLRQNLTNSLITTYGYNNLDELVRIIDENGVRTSYEYDEFGRLLMVKDHEGNILKKHTYHYAN